MQRTLRSRPIVAALAAILAGLTLSLSVIAVADDRASSATMPAGGCPPSC